MKIYLKGKCNNDCLFCKIDKKRNSSIFQIRKQIENFSNKKRIVFTGAEPTIRKDIFDLLSLVKKKKVNIIQLNTNGRLLADEIFAKKIIKAGANYFKIPLHSFDAQLHDKITQKENSFEETIKGIKNLIKLKQKDNIVLSVVLSKLNYRDLIETLKLAKQIGLKKAQLNIVETDDKKLIVPLEVLANHISQARYRLFFDLLIKVKNIPYCLIPEPESLFLQNKKSKDYQCLAECLKCKHDKICLGVLKSYANLSNLSKIKAFLDLPVEIMLEVESRCNFNCQFCFNRSSFAAKGHGGQKLSKEYIKKIVNNIKKTGIPRVRFTGGEPLLRDDIFELIKYAKNKGLETRLNTNGSLIKSYKQVKEMVKYLDYVLFAMHAYDSENDEIMTGFKNSFKKKIKAIKWFKKAGIKIIRVNTIATLDNIRNLDKFYNLFKKLKIDRWAVNRVIPVSKKDKTWNKKEVSLLVKKLIEIKKDKFKNKVPIQVHIVNAAPLCADDPLKLNTICSGGRSVDGHERFAIDPRGFAKPIYYLEKNIGDPLDILNCWNHPFMKSLRSYKILPKECRECSLLEKCKGGNRYCAYVAKGNYQSADPLMDYSKIEKYIW